MTPSPRPPPPLPSADEFIVNTPTTLAQKYWITNGAIHAKWVVVFAHLKMGDTNHGIHGFLVRIRDDNLKVMPQDWGGVGREARGAVGGMLSGKLLCGSG